MFRNLFATIQHVAETIPDRSDAEIYPDLKKLHIVYRSLTEILTVVEGIMSPLLSAQMICLLPSLILNIPLVKDSLNKGECIRAFGLTANTLGYFLNLTMISNFEADHHRSYNTIYQLSFDHDIKIMKEVSRFVIK